MTTRRALMHTLTITPTEARRIVAGELPLPAGIESDPDVRAALTLYDRCGDRLDKLRAVSLEVDAGLSREPGGPVRRGMLRRRELVDRELSEAAAAVESVARQVVHTVELAGVCRSVGVRVHTA
jgi:hypothetical protein